MNMTPQHEALLEQKFESLGRLLPEDTEARCEVELERTAEHQSGKIYRAEANLTVGGKFYRAEATEEQIEMAIDEVRDELKRELTKDEGKRRSLWKRGSQAIKNMLRFGSEE